MDLAAALLDPGPTSDPDSCIAHTFVWMPLATLSPRQIARGLKHEVQDTVLASYMVKKMRTGVSMHVCMQSKP
jgi:hypothetical protein